MKKILTILSLLLSVSLAWGHCQVPCGIFDDSARIQQINEHITTIEKAMTQIEKIGATNLNQSIRWVNTKESHANELSHILHDYFLTQRLKPLPEKYNDSDERKYEAKLRVIHQMSIATMKSKQSTNTEHPKNLRKLNKRLAKLFLH